MTPMTLKSRTLALLLAIGLIPSVAQSQETFQTSNLHEFGGTNAVDGAATLYRTANSLWLTVSTSDLDKKAAYTVWFVVWNDPLACATNPCSAADLGSGDSAVIYGAGFVTGTDGTATVTAHLNAGPLAAGRESPLPGVLEVDNGFGAEVHVIVRSHGRTIPGQVDSQIGSVGGACGTNTCIDQQAAIFLPVAAP